MKTISKEKFNCIDDQGLLPLDLINDPFIILGADGAIVDSNASFTGLVSSARGPVNNMNFSAVPLLNELSGKITHCLSTASDSEIVERVSYNSRNFEAQLLPFSHSDGSRRIRIILRDITNFIRLEKELLKKNKELMVINTLSNAFISSENMDLIMEDLIDKVLLITDFQTGWIVIREGHHFRLKTNRGISTDFQKHITGGDLDLLCPDALKINEPLYIFGTPVLSKMQLLRDEGIVFLVALPLISNHKPTGLLFLAGRVSREVGPDLADLLSLVGNHVSHIIDKIRLFEETKRLSITDGLTGLYNSRYFYRYLELEIARTRRYGRSFSLILFDIDDFKRFNDTYGHQAGDEVLQALARVLQAVSRESDTVVRYGGEEFIIILPNTSEEEAIALANRILQSVQKTKIKISAAVKVNITLSGGIASYPLNAVSAKALLNAADNAMYAAKSAGKNTIICFQGK